ncbi:MAG: ActS/PrrB/RegB family redox-sensitive histidine kinase [Alphaproteobacteria bacterium]
MRMLSQAATGTGSESYSGAQAQAAGAPLGATSKGRVRLGTLNNLRWLAVAGQTAALLIVYFVLGYELPLLPCIAAIAASGVLNVALAAIYPAARRLSSREAAAYLGYDILQLAVLLYLTGGIENPFALLFVAPVVISAATLELTYTLLLAALSFIAISFLAYFHMPLPWSPAGTFRLPALYQFGIWISLVLGIGFTSIYARRIAGEAQRMSAALTATQLALAREHRLSALGALAAAAAHKLGSPLGTIAVVSRELERELPQDSPHQDDVRLLRAEAERCRGILARLSEPEEAVRGAAQRIPLGALLDDIASPHRGVDVDITVEMPDGKPLEVWRTPELLHGLGNLIENAADFARRAVKVRAQWDERSLSVDVMDDGPGFAPEIFDKIGEPYVTSRPRWRTFVGSGPGKLEGMGLGYFIAKTLIEQAGGTLTAYNPEQGGAIVRARWPRGAIDGEAPPALAFGL